MRMLHEAPCLRGSHCLLARVPREIKLNRRMNEISANPYRTSNRRYFSGRYARSLFCAVFQVRPWPRTKSIASNCVALQKKKPPPFGGGQFIHDFSFKDGPSPLAPACSGASTLACFRHLAVKMSKQEAVYGKSRRADVTRTVMLSLQRHGAWSPR
jgi:hypothetical protein